MKKDILEYYPNGSIKHIIEHYINGNIRYEYFFDENVFYNNHNNLPAIQEWHANGKLSYQGYYNHNNLHNIFNPSTIHFNYVGKINIKFYHINDNDCDNKLNWQNHIKNIR